MRSQRALRAGQAGSVEGKAAPGMKARRSATPGERVEHFDFVKGSLVVLMVIYHWLNYYVGLQWGGYRYLRFLTPSFIFITGFLVSHIYLRRHSPGDPRLHRRLAARGLKLVFLFISLNIAVEYTIGGRLGLNFRSPSTLVAAAKAVFVNSTGLAAFDVLVSIAYFLLLAPGVLVLSLRLRISIWTVAALAVSLVAIADLMSGSNLHLEMLAIACVGLAAGVRYEDDKLKELRRPAVLIPLYLIYVGAITLWNTPFLLQVVGVCLSVLLIDVIAVACGAQGRIQRWLIRMGQYSLLAYIAQVAVLQVLWRTFPPAGAASLVPLLLTLAMTLIVVELTIALRARSLFIDRVYRAMFA